MGRRRGRSHLYGPGVKEALKTVWEASDRLCSKRLQPFLPQPIRVLAEHGELEITFEVARQVHQVSAATIGRLLRPYKEKGI